MGLPLPSEEERVRDARYTSPEEAQKQGREVRFRLNIVAAYNYTCALTRYRLTTINAGSIVDAAHIHTHGTRRRIRLLSDPLLFTIFSRINSQ